MKTHTRFSGKPLTGFGLKLIAVICMFCDHFAVAFYTRLPHDIYMLLRIVGRPAMPIFCFLLSEGARHTKSPEKYLGRMALFAVLSEIPFDLINTGKAVNFESQSVMVTLTAGLILLFVIEKTKSFGIAKRLGISLLVLVAVCVLVDFVNSDYGIVGIFFILVMYYCAEKPLLCVLLLAVGSTVGMSLVYPGSAGFDIFGIKIPVQSEIFSVFSVLPIYLYGGKRGFDNKAVKYGFYAFYPVHLLLLAVAAEITLT